MWTKMDWLEHLNTKLRKHNVRVKQVRPDDPSWMVLGDYVMVNLKNNTVIQRHLNFRDIAPRVQRQREVTATQ